MRALLLTIVMLSLLLVALCVAGEADRRPRREGVVLYKLKDSASAQDKKALKQLLRKYGMANIKKLVNGKVNVARALKFSATEEQLAAELQAHAAVEFAEPDYAVPAEATANDPSAGSQWHLPNISAPQAWDITTGSSSIVVAILDTGCDPTHPDLVPNYVAGWNFYDNNNNTADVQGHGTAVAGCVGAAGNNAIGIASVSWHSKIMPVRIAFNNGGQAYAYWSTVAQGMQWAADRGAKIQNCSYVGLAGSSTIKNAASYVKSKGGIFVAAAGNDATNPGFAVDPNILVVSGTTESNTRASFSNYGNYVTVSAPATNIYTTRNGGYYGAAAGTSFAAPIACGVLALTWSANAGLSNTDLRSILIQSTDDLGTAGFDLYFGYGKVNALKAVTLAKSYVVNQAPVAIAAGSPTSGAAPLIVGLNGSASYDNDGSITSFAWNFGDGTSGSGASVPHTYTSAGTFTATLTVTDNAGATASSSVTISVTDPNQLNAPSNLSASISGLSVSLNWQDNSGNESGFYIERAPKAKGTAQFTRIGQVAADVRSYTDTLSSLGSYLYRVQAFSASGVSAYSNQVQARVR